MEGRNYWAWINDAPVEVVEIMGYDDMKKVQEVKTGRSHWLHLYAWWSSEEEATRVNKPAPPAKRDGGEVG